MNVEPLDMEKTMNKATVTVVYHAQSVRMEFGDRDKAKAAYDIVNDALKSYQRFKNDRSEVVEVVADEGLTTLKLERMDAVLFAEPNQTYDIENIRKQFEQEKAIRGLRSELGLPASVN